MLRVNNHWLNHRSLSISASWHASPASAMLEYVQSVFSPIPYDDHNKHNDKHMSESPWPVAKTSTYTVWSTTLHWINMKTQRPDANIPGTDSTWLCAHRFTLRAVGSVWNGKHSSLSHLHCSFPFYDEFIQHLTTVDIVTRWHWWNAYWLGVNSDLLPLLSSRIWPFMFAISLSC